LRHLVVDEPRGRGHLPRERAGHDQEVALARAEARGLGSEARDVELRPDHRHELDAAARQPERHRPQAVLAAPVHQRVEPRGEEARPPPPGAGAQRPHPTPPSRHTKASPTATTATNTKPSTNTAVPKPFAASSRAATAHGIRSRDSTSNRMNSTA